MQYDLTLDKMSLVPDNRSLVYDGQGNGELDASHSQYLLC